MTVAVLRAATCPCSPGEEFLGSGRLSQPLVAGGYFTSHPQRSQRSRQPGVVFRSPRIGFPFHGLLDHSNPFSISFRIEVNAGRKSDMCWCEDLTEPGRPIESLAHALHKPMPCIHRRCQSHLLAQLTAMDRDFIGPAGLHFSDPYSEQPNLAAFLLQMNALKTSYRVSGTLGPTRNRAPSILWATKYLLQRTLSVFGQSPQKFAVKATGIPWASLVCALDWSRPPHSVMADVESRDPLQQL